MIRGPQVEILRYELGPLTDSDPLGPTMRRSDPLEGVDHVIASITVPHIKRRRQSREVVDDRQDTDLAPVERLVR